LRQLEERDKKLFAPCIEELPPKEKLILSLYYWDGLTMREIARVLDMNENKICQLRNKALIYLRMKIRVPIALKIFYKIPIIYI